MLDKHESNEMRILISGRTRGRDTAFHSATNRVEVRTWHLPNSNPQCYTSNAIGRGEDDFKAVHRHEDAGVPRAQPISFSLIWSPE